jgi:hypothetical protein
MAWSMPFWSAQGRRIACDAEDRPADDAWARHVARLAAQGVAEPGRRSAGAGAAGHPGRPRCALRRRAVVRGLAALGGVPARRKCMLLEDGQSVAAFFELAPVGTEGREMAWLWQARDALENALQDSFDELDDNPWVVQLYAQDEADWDNYLRSLAAICSRVRRAAPSATSTCASSPITCGPSPSRVACSRTPR